MRELENKIEIIENEIDLQVESLIAEIHKCSDELRSKLRNQKEELEKFPRLILMGDFNIAPKDEDVHDPKAWEGQNLVSPEERAYFAAFEELGLIDGYRIFDQAPKSFSWWDYRMMGFRRNAGLRIDHIMVSKELQEHCSSCQIDIVPRKWEQPSDHAPVILSLQK